MKRNKFVLVGSNNFWYASMNGVSEVCAEKRAKEILEGTGRYEDPESGYCPEVAREIYIFEVKSKHFTVYPDE